jgi:hypothetical protein
MSADDQAFLDVVSKLERLILLVSPHDSGRRRNTADNRRPLLSLAVLHPQRHPTLLCRSDAVRRQVHRVRRQRGREGVRCPAPVAFYSTMASREHAAATASTATRCDPADLAVCAGARLAVAAQGAGRGGGVDDRCSSVSQLQEKSVLQENAQGEEGEDGWTHGGAGCCWVTGAAIDQSCSAGHGEKGVCDFRGVQQRRG